MRWVLRRLRLRGDDGQVTLLVIGFAATAMLLVGVVTDASAVFLARRALMGAADGAAVAAANAVDERVVYAGELGRELPLSAEGVRAAAAEHLAAGGGDLAPVLLEASTDGTTATVVVGARVDLRFGGALPGAWRSVELTATASARSPVG